MIPTRPGFVAEFAGYTADSPIEAYDDEGYALVLDTSAGRLVRAADLEGFRGIAGHPDVIVAAVPGQGWQMVWRDEDEHENVVERTSDVAAFAIDCGGYGSALRATGHGTVERMEPGAVVRFVPPSTS